MVGTVRVFDNPTREKIEEGIRKYAQAIAQAWDGQADVEYERLVEFVDNDRASAELAQKVVTESFGEENLRHNPATMGSEDFGYFSQQVPGTFATVGCRNPEKGANYPHHHPNFNIDEDALKTGAELYAQYALAYLDQDEF